MKTDPTNHGQQPVAPTGQVLLTVDEVRRALRIGTTTLYKLVAQGQLDALKIGAATRITRASVEKLVAEAPGAGQHPG